MKRLILAIALWLAPTLAFAQCNGLVANNTVCGNVSGGQALMTPTPTSSIPTAPGGTNGQVQYNNNGVLGGTSFTANLPIIGTGPGVPPGLTTGTKTGNTTTFATATGSFTVGNCVKFDVNSNLIDAGAPCASTASRILLTTPTTFFVGPPGTAVDQPGCGLASGAAACATR